MDVRRNLLTPARAFGVLLVAWAVTCFAPGDSGVAVEFAAHAADAKRKSRQVPYITEITYRKLGQVQELIDKEEYQEALETLSGMIESRRSSAYNNNERGQIHNMLAFVYYEIEDTQNAIHHFEQVLAQVPDITEALENTTLERLARFYFQQGYNTDGAEAQAWFDKSLKTIRDWISKIDDISPDAYYFISSIYYQMKDYRQSLENLERAVGLEQERGNKVSETWWTMLQALYVEMQDWQKYVQVSETLVKDYPKRRHWLSLAGAYGQINEGQKQLWTFEAAHVGGFLEQEGDFQSYGGLLLQNDVPNRASKYLQQSIDEELIERSAKNLKLLGQSYQIGRDFEHAIPVLEEAAELDEDGEIYVRLASLYLVRDENEKCRVASEKALEKGGLRSKLTPRITLGTCLFNLKEYSKAREVFTDIRDEARRSKETKSDEKLAQQWLRYIAGETERQAALRSSAR